MKNRIEILRKAHRPKMTQELLAELCGTTKQTMGRLANGKQPLTVEWMEKISAALGCEPYELIADKEQILQIEAAHLIKQRRVINAYEQLQGKDREVVDLLLFGKQGQENEARKKQIASPTPTGAPSQSLKSAER